MQATQEVKKAMKISNFNSDINTIGGLPNYEILHLALKTATDGDLSVIEEALITNNEFNLRTETARGRFLRGIRSNLLQFRNEDHRALVKALFATEGYTKTKNFTFFWQMALNNELFYAITKELYLKLYFSGRASFPKNEVEAYIAFLQENNPDLKKWSPKTIATLSSKYLTFFKKIDFLTGSKKKEFNHIQADSTTFLFFIYMMKAVYPEVPNIYETDLFGFLFMSKEAFSERAKKAEYLEYYDYSYNGVSLKLEPKYKTKELINVLFK